MHCTNSSTFFSFSYQTIDKKILKQAIKIDLPLLSDSLEDSNHFNHEEMDGNNQNKTL